MAGAQGVRVLGAVGITISMRGGDSVKQVPGRRVAAAIAEVRRDVPHAVAGQVKDGQGVGQQHRARRPRRGQLRVGGDRLLDQGGGGLFPLASRLRRELGAGNGLHQAVRQHQAIPGRSHQGIAAQRGDRIPRRHRITQQRPDPGRHLGAQQARRLFTDEQQGQRDRLGCQERQQPHQPGRRAGASPASRDTASPSVAATSAGCPEASPAGQQVGLPGARNSGRYRARVVPVACMYAAACSRASGSPQLDGQFPAAARSGSPVRVTRKSAATCGASTGTSRAWPGGQC